MEQNLMMSCGVLTNYFDVMGPADVAMAGPSATPKKNTERTVPLKCVKCLAKERTKDEKKSVSVLPKQQYVFKQSTYGQRCLSRQDRGLYGSQISPRSNDSIHTGRTCTSTYSSPRVKSTMSSTKMRISSSNPDLRNFNNRVSRNQSTNRQCSKFCGTGFVNSRARAGQQKPEAAATAPNHNNVSVLNIKSNTEESDVLEVNPRKAVTPSDKMIIIQHLPQVDIRPELSKQCGPVISIDAQATFEEQNDPKQRNIGVFSYVHKSKPTFQRDECKLYSNFNRSKALSENRCSAEESFAAQLELRSVAENFIFRLKKNGNASGSILMSTLLRLMDEINEMIDENLSSGDPQLVTDPNLPPRLEMVSDLLSDELKTWGAQQPRHYHSLNNIIQHLILDIHFAKHGEYPQPPGNGSQ